MLPHCPKCLTQLLITVDGTRASTGAAALRCALCSGFWVPPEIVTVAAISALLGELDGQAAHSPTAEMRTGQCPDGHGLLRRARVTWHDPYFLERCARCGGVWFDAGEWSRAAADQLLDNLSEVWSPAWRKHLSDEQAHAALQGDLRAKLGPQLFSSLDDLANRLEAHPQRAVALAYLSDRLKHPGESGEE